MDICQTDPIQLQLLLNRFGSQDQLIANVCMVSCSTMREMY